MSSDPRTDEPVHCLRCGTRLDPFFDGERDRLRCPRDGWIHYGNPVPVVAALVEHEGAIVLVRNPGWPPKFHGLVSGFLEAGETPEAGVLREVKEELGLGGEVVSLIGVYGFELRNEVLICYHVKAHGTVVMGAELEGVKRIAPEKLQPWPMGTGHAVRDWLARRKA